MSPRPPRSTRTDPRVPYTPLFRSVSPFAAGLAALVEDEMDLGVTVIDMGGGTTTIAVFFDGNVVFTDSVPIGGAHVTSDIARGLSTPIVHAERMKTLYASCLASPADERERSEEHTSELQ